VARYPDSTFGDLIKELDAHPAPAETSEEELFAN
jgi:hypothetical protein